MATIRPHHTVVPHARMNPKTVSASGGSNHPTGLVTVAGAAACGRHKRTPGVDT